MSSTHQQALFSPPPLTYISEKGGNKKKEKNLGYVNGTIIESEKNLQLTRPHGHFHCTERR